MINVVHVASSDLYGGAARACYRIHRSLVENQQVRVSTHLRVISRHSDDTSVIGGPPLNQHPLWRILQPRLSRLPLHHFRSNNPIWHSSLWPDTGLGSELNRSYLRGAIDIVHLHWLSNETISIEEIGRLQMPLVWTLHDQWAFCGAEHYAESTFDAVSMPHPERYTCSYRSDSRPIDELGPDLNRRTWKRKRRAWRRQMQIVCPSTWMADCVQRSSIMSSWPTHVIPNPIDLKVWSPCDKFQARKFLGLPLEHPLLLFGAMDGLADPRKGADLLSEALLRLHNDVSGTPLDKTELIVFGQSRPATPMDLGFPVHYFGRLYDDISLRLLYAAADLFLIPSRQDNLPNTGLEAHACGTPIVAFHCGGMSDIVDNGKTGLLVQSFSSIDFAYAIRQLLSDSVRLRSFAASSRIRAERLWSSRNISGLYADLYAQTVDAHTVRH